MWPWIIRFINSTPASSYGQMFFGKMNKRKKQLLSKMFSATKDHLTIVRNIENLFAWMAKTDHSVYQHIKHGTFLIPKMDRILDRELMLKSAQFSPNSVRIIETDAMSHFITLDDQKWIPSMHTIPSGNAAEIVKKSLTNILKKRTSAA
jgi:hypothetical protein